MKILISGGTSGIGYEMACQLLTQGHFLILLGRQDISLEKRERLRSISDQFEVFCCDLAVSSEVEGVCREISQKHGCPQVLVNNAGYATYETFERMDPTEAERLVSVNFMGAVRLTKYFIKGFIERGSGKILNISSIAGEIVMTPNIMYMAAKQAMNAWSLALSYEVARFGIQVQTFCPGRVNTSFFDHPTFVTRAQRPEMKKALAASEVAAKAIDFLSSTSQKSFIPGHYRLIAWIYRSLPGVREIAFARLMKSRVQDYYQGEL